MKKIYFPYIIGFFLFLLLIIGNTIYSTHKPIVLIVKEDLEKKDDYEKTIKREAYNNVMKIFESEYDDIQFVSKVIDFSNDTNRIKIDFNQVIQKNKDNLVYIIFMPGDTSKYNKIKKYLPESIPIITSIGTVKVLNKNNTWVTTTSSLAKGKADAIKKLIQIENKNGLIVLYDENDSNDTYTKEVIEDLNKTVSVQALKIDYKKSVKIEHINKLQEKNKLILLASKSSTETKGIFNKFIDKIYINLDHKNDILLLKTKKEDKKDINLTKSKIFELTYTIPGYNPDSRLPLYQEVEDMCDKIEKIDKHMCQEKYGDAYIKLYTYLDLALNAPDTNSDINISKNNEVNITEMRENIHEHITNHNKTNIYYNEETNALAKFKKKKSENFYYSALIESNITNYYIVRLDNKDDGFLHYNQISNENGNVSLSTVYLDMKLSNLIVENLSASSTYIEGNIRILTTKKEFDLDKMYRMNFIDNALNKSEIIFIKGVQKVINGIKMYEKFYTFKGNFNIKNDLKEFPFDEQKIYVSFTPKDASTGEDRYLMHLQEQEDNKIIDFDKWYVKEIKPFLSKEIIMFKTSAIERNSSVSYKPVSNFEITIKRETAYDFMSKFIVPIGIILLLAVGTQLHLHRRRDLGVAISIFISAFAGIISIYFIFNLLIGIESLIYFDYIFLLCLLVPVVFMIYNINKHRKI